MHLVTFSCRLPFFFLRDSARLNFQSLSLVTLIRAKSPFLSKSVWALLRRLLSSLLSHTSVNILDARLSPLLFTDSVLAPTSLTPNHLKPCLYTTSHWDWRRGTNEAVAAQKKITCGEAAFGGGVQHWLQRTYWFFLCLPRTPLIFCQTFLLSLWHSSILSHVYPCLTKLITCR